MSIVGFRWAGAPALLAGIALAGCSATTEPPVAPPAHVNGAGVAHVGRAADGGQAVETFPGSEARTVRGAVTAMFTAYDEKDLGRWLGAWTDKGFEQAFGVTKAEAALVPPSWGDVRSFRQSQVQVLDLVDHGTHSAGGTAHDASLASEHGVAEHAVIDTMESGIVTRQRLDFDQDRGRWRVAGRTALPVPPAGDVVEARLTEHRIELSRPTAGRNVVLRVVNQGLVRHELLLLRDRGGQDETVGRVAAQAPGQSWNLVARDLPAGDYALVCNLLDDEGRPHSTLGMRVTLRIA